MKSSYVIAAGIAVVAFAALLLSAATASGPFDPFTTLGLATFATGIVGWSLIIGGVIVKLVALGVREGKAVTTT